MDPPQIGDQTVLITGGAGFVGSHLADSLVEAPNTTVRVLDSLTTGSRTDVPSGARFIEGDIRDRTTLETATRDVDIIFHLAATVSVDISVDKPIPTHETNCSGTLSLLECARKADARVVLASSAAVYGQPETVPITEAVPLEPTSPYGVQKLAADHYARLYNDLYDLPTVALRYFNIYGPRQQGPYSGVISTFLEQARAGEPITVQGDGGQTRDFVHVDDVVSANLQAATTNHTGEAFNIATGETTSIERLATLIARVVDTDSPVVYREPRPGDIRHSHADISKATTQLNFTPRRSLESGINDLVQQKARIEGGTGRQHRG